MKNLLVIIIILGAMLHLNAQNEPPENEGFSAGVGLTQHQEDFGIGAQITSPYFGRNHFAIRLRGNLLWNQHVSGTKTRWSSYTNVSLGMIGVTGKLGDFARLYSEGGLVLLFLPDRISSEHSVIGGYGLLGFEFFNSPQTNYYLEIGGIGTGATADLNESEPIYSNGFLINVGFRYRFKRSSNRKN